MIFELGNEKVVITCQITYISPLGRISGRKATVCTTNAMWPALSNSQSASNTMHVAIFFYLPN